MNPRLSVVIPSYKDPLLHPTIQSLLEQSVDPIEIIAVLDGYWTKVVDDPRVRVLHLGKNRGMRGAINAGVSIAKGEFLMRVDEHCTFAPCYDRALTSQCEDNWIVYPKRYFLDTKQWKVMDLEPVACEKLVIDPKYPKFAGVRWRSRDESEAGPLIESMAMQGSCWVMKKSWWDTVIKELQTEGYGPHYQDSHEMVFKTWQAGGKLMVNTSTWYAHKHRDFPRTHNLSRADAQPGWDYSLNVWGDYYRNVVQPAWGV